MGLSRLDNFLKSVRGTIIYVDPNSLDSTDSIENQGNSLTRPFKTIQRALVEAARFSYQRGKDNDRFGKTTILLYPGDHVVDNRPGWIPTGSGTFQLRSSETSTDFSDWDLTTNFDLNSSANALYKLNSVHGGIIIPRGTSIVGLDLRKTKIRPTYVPDPDPVDGKEIERSAVFRLTGSSYIWQFTILDADPNGVCYYNYTNNTRVPNFSHHKLTAFEYADGVNNVVIDDDFITDTNYGRTDLDMYYEKVGLCYGQSSGREISNDYPPSSVVDIEPVIDEYRIVGSRGSEVGITSIFAGNGITATNIITVVSSEPLEGLSVDSPIQISGVPENGYDGKFVVNTITSNTEFTYRSSITPGDPVGSTTNSTVSLSVDTVTSASPYIFNVSLRSVYGMCGLLADGDKATGFKSMVVAQFTGVGLQKDDNAFAKYDSGTGTYKFAGSNYTNLFADSQAKYRPEYENFHIKATNDAYLQLVSVFSIGYANHFIVENGGDMSINNSNSNFGAKALVASGFKREAFARDNTGYITHIITPQEIEGEEGSVEFVAVDVEKTVGVASTNRLYLYNYTTENNPPLNIIDGYRLGAKVDDQLYVQVLSAGISTEYSARIIMPSTEYTIRETSFEKSFVVIKDTNLENSIVDGVISFGQTHSFATGESVRVIGDNGSLPSGLSPSKVYYAIGIGSTQIKLAQTYSDAFQGNAIVPNKKGGNLTVVSRVSDKNAGDIGHPVQWDSTQSQWYINVATAATENTIYTNVVGLGTTSLGSATSRTYIKRRSDFRNLSDTIYKIRYVIPKSSSVIARPPLDAFVLQDASSGIGTGTNEIEKYFDLTDTLSLSNENELRNPRFISTCTWSSSGIATVTTELPHDLRVGNSVEIVNVKSTNNTTGIANSAFNGTFSVYEVNNSTQFTYQLDKNPGSFTSNTSTRDENLPRFSRKTLSGTYQLYRSQEIQEYIPNVQDGVYHLLVVNSSNSPNVSPFENLKFSQPIQYLYPQLNRDNPASDPESAKSFAAPDIIGRVVINEPQKSITKETVENLLDDINVGFGITNIVSNSAGTAHTIFTKYDHGFAGITSVSITGAGSTYVAGTYYNVPLVGAAGSTTGNYATAAVTVSAGGTISKVVIMNRGSAYGIGNTLSILSIPRNAGSVNAVVTVNNIQNNINDVLVLSGVSLLQYNGVYEITQIPVGKTNSIVVGSAVSITSPSTTGLGSTITSDANVVVSGKSVGIATITYDSSTGISTIGFGKAHGFGVNDKIKVVGSSDTLFNGDFIVKTTPGIGGIAATTLTINTGVKNASPIFGGTLVAYPLYLGSYGGDLTSENEKTSARLISRYAGITTVSTSLIDINSTNNDPLTIQNAVSTGLRMGDYIQIDDEIFRIRQAVTSDSVYVFRAVLGTQKQTHLDNSVVRKIKPVPIEFRRNSIIRASGHTFEYMGFGPGNYSTALPERQDRIISGQEEILSQAIKINGGVAIFTGMNSDGDFYTGNKKINSSTGQEEIFDAPVPTVTGEEPDVSVVNIGFDVLTPLEISVNRSIRVEGGSDSTLISEFDGPVVFNNKITSTSSRGIEASSLYLQGDAPVSRNFTVGISTPTTAGNPGDVVTRSLPESGKTFGWVYTTNNRWEPFGIIGENGTEPASGVGISSAGTYVGFSTLINFVGLGVSLTVETNNALNGITTITIDDNPTIGISTGAFNTLLGSAKQLNFVGGGVTVSSVDPTGIVTIFMEKLDLNGLGPDGNVNTFQYHQDNSTFAGLDYFVYNDINDNIQISNINLTRNSRIGIGSVVPSSKLDIYSTAERSLYINSITGTGEVVRIENSLGDITPFIIDYNGSVGINTGSITTGISLDVVGNTGVTGEIRYYNATRSNYTALKAPDTLSSNLVWTLPNVVGAANSVLYSVSPGVLGWTSIQQSLSLATTDNLVEGSTNRYYTDARVVNKVKTLIGDQCGINVTFNEATQQFDYEVIVSQEYAPWPYSTRGFALPI